MKKQPAEPSTCEAAMPRTMPPSNAKWRRIRHRIALPAIDFLFFIVAYGVNVVLSYIDTGTLMHTHFKTWPNFLILLLLAMGTRILAQVYSNIWRYPNVKAYLILVITDAVSGSLSFLLTYALSFVPAGDISNPFLHHFFTHIYIGFWQTFFVMVSFDLISLTARFAYQLYHQFTSSHPSSRFRPDGAEKNKIGVAIVGAGQIGNLLASEMLLNGHSRYTPVCFIDSNQNKVGARLNNLPVYEDNDQIIRILKNLPVQEVFVAIPHLSSEKIEHMVRMYGEAGYRVKSYDYPIKETMDQAWSGDPRHRVVRDFRVEDLLGRQSLEQKINTSKMRSCYKDRVVLVTGGGGSIGSEICRQIAKCHPKRLIVLDIYENNAYNIQQELIRKYGSDLDLCVEIASVRDVKRLDCVFDTYRPEIVFHAAAHKHVPLMEHSSCEAIKNNVMGTYNTANMAEKYGTQKFVLISTDKAVNPTNVMGASKRMCEMVIQCRMDHPTGTSFAAVRFGNVLGSNGSVIPLFQSQIEKGGPVTVTDKRIVRYFMTIPEASQLVMAAGSIAENGQLFVLDMGKPVKILDLAENMIRMAGYIPDKDIKIQEIGLRPGEKLYEELLIKSDCDTLKKTDNDLIFVETASDHLTRADVEEKLKILNEAVEAASHELASPKIREAMKKVVPTFHEPEEVNERADEQLKNTRSIRQPVPKPAEAAVK